MGLMGKYWDNDRISPSRRGISTWDNGDEMNRFLSSAGVNVVLMA